MKPQGSSLSVARLLASPKSGPGFWLRTLSPNPGGDLSPPSPPLDDPPGVAGEWSRNEKLRPPSPQFLLLFLVYSHTWSQSSSTIKLLLDVRISPCFPGRPEGMGREFLGAAQAELLPSGAEDSTWEGDWSLVSMKETSTCRTYRGPSRISGKEPCAYQTLLTSGREGWTRAGNLGEFSKIFHSKDIYSRWTQEHFDFWVLQRM